MCFLLKGNPISAPPVDSSRGSKGSGRSQGSKLGGMEGGRKVGKESGMCYNRC